MTPANPALPVTLAVKLDYATCDKICIPAEAQARLDLAPRAAADAEASLLAHWMERTSQPANRPGVPWLSVRAELQNSRAWRVKVTPALPGDDLFAEAPEGWSFDTKPASDGFDLLLAQMPADAPKGPVAVVLTLVSNGKTFELRSDLDVSAPKP